MSQSPYRFQAAEVGEKFKRTCIKFDSLLAQEKINELSELRKQFRQGLKTYKEQGVLRVAFVGQYSAGKSTIISALTGRRDIRIDADIATDQTSNYAWNGIQVTDTPGLFTERADHDDMTYAAIEKADLLVFCLTYMLFDSITVENFKKLAFEKGYRWKMMLVINKMSDEAGEEEQKIANYRKSLADALQPYAIEEFPVCFMDAKDYCEGVDESDDFLIEISRFQTFIEELNKFVQRRASLARMDTPVRIALGCVDEAQVLFMRNSKQDSTFLELLARLSRTVRKERDRLRTRVQSITLKMASAVVREGTTVAVAVGGEENIEQVVKKAELNVQAHYEQAETELQTALDAACQSVQTEVEKVFQSDLTQAFMARLVFDQKVGAENVKAEINAERLKGQVNWLQDIGMKAGVSLAKAAKRNLVSTAGKGFLGSMDVAGSSLHQSVLAVGKFVGFKFKPWQAVGVAKNIGNAAMLIGPIFAVASFGADMYAMHEERENERKLAEARQNITSEFQKAAKDLENQVEVQLWEFESQVYQVIDQMITEARQNEEAEIASSNGWVRQLMEIRKEFESLLKDIASSLRSTDGV